MLWIRWVGLPAVGWPVVVWGPGNDEIDLLYDLSVFVSISDPKVSMLHNVSAISSVKFPWADSEFS